MDFKVGEVDNINSIKEFVERRSKMPLPDQLHAIWLCTQAPNDGGPLIQPGVATLIEVLEQSGHSTPIIVVFTKLDELSDQILQRDANLNEASARRRTNEDVEMLCKKQKFKRPFVCVSWQTDYEVTLIDLTTMTIGQTKNHGKSLLTGFSNFRPFSRNQYPNALEVIADNMAHNQGLMRTSQRNDLQRHVDVSIGVERRSGSRYLGICSRLTV